MTQNLWLKTVRHHRAIGVVRAPELTLGVRMAEAIAQAGMTLIEIAWNSYQSATLVTQLREILPNCQIGVGTILTVDQLHFAIAAGAQFCFCPHVNLNIIQAAVAQDIPIIPGALSPTEIVTAWQAGASSVKIFPVEMMGGSQYIQSLQGPLGHIPVIPTGGVTLENAVALIQAGAVGVGLSSYLFPKEALQAEDWPAITRRTEQLLQQLQDLCCD
ncbi:bifunctional 4-hydroxy-2-oxoglutarate aldolase/2-dehydro-3-deoxy-phosphogluconate aldolase [Acaryochloris marina]|uniref:2-dehydro-3-deoxyphosphogluconate aldolase/4-hydroxy-2-oxoglutarate aldolase n=1 Tax=Acaryochloris marina (strain MBIC 11017) TaxID=329726 RepID=B0C3M6_ACAM1|nr:bifunctional 4-hydroxy-2-oxoglutarate aldolase/2-dehydro-3-deoxy-phosphogluconate aldolase [Acaryochloris marina]ABW29860.1 2-dehydro-3-deoxyphosphogluconate aldolase/4-hydroxy-2-oxoglutarate aldolase [Acaryochloris marina MBIC11017]BDM78737.1 2-dehydro-3-deoxy-phosphogluconate aldolase [Acaryochloris marina MBIC10699]